jgi:hypothetical protein
MNNDKVITHLSLQCQLQKVENCLGAQNVLLPSIHNPYTGPYILDDSNTVQHPAYFLT